MSSGFNNRGWMQWVAAGNVYTINNSQTPISYAPNGNVLAANDSVNGNWTYSYDDFNRLRTAAGPGQSYSYDYDRFGNRWHQNVTAGSRRSPSYSFDANNHITSSGITYDAAGNITYDGFHNYTYDAENRLIQVDGGATASYEYDAFGRRTRKQVGASTSDYVYDQQGRILEEYDQSGSLVRVEIYANGRPLATYHDGNTYFYQQDWLGTVRMLTNSAGAVSNTCTSLPFGDNLSCTSNDELLCAYYVRQCGKTTFETAGLDNLNKDPMKLLYDAEQCKLKGGPTAVPRDGTTFNGVDFWQDWNCTKAFECVTGEIKP